MAHMGRFRRDYPYYVLLLPAMLFYVVFKYVPMYGVVIAFKDYGIFRGIWASEWVGLYNFKQLFHSRDFLEAFRNTLIINAYKLVFGFPAPIVLALMLHELTSRRFRRVIQTITYLPHFLSWIIFGGIVAAILSPSTGLFGYLFRLIREQAPVLLGDPLWFRGILVTTDIWKEVGWGSIIYLAALTGVNSALYEAAAIDGAGYWRRLWSVTLPSITGTIAAVFILRVGHVLEGGFDQVFVLLSPTLYHVGDIIDTYVYRIGMEQRQYSMATAAGLFQAVIGFAFMTASNYWLRRKAGGGIW